MQTFSIKQQSERLQNAYWKYGQQFRVGTDIVWQDETHNLDLWLLDDKEDYHTFLFTIRTYKDYDIEDSIVYRSCKDQFKNVYSGQEFMSNHKVVPNHELKYKVLPYYFNEVFTHPQFSPITDTQIRECVDYYLHQVLDTLLIFNIDIIKHKE